MRVVINGLQPVLHPYTSSNQAMLQTLIIDQTLVSPA